MAAPITTPDTPLTTSGPLAPDTPLIGGRALRDLQRADTLQVIVKTETPMLPRAAFTLITLASLGGAIFTGLGLGVSGFGLFARWFALWTMGLAGGFLVWRLLYLRRTEKEADEGAVDVLNADLLDRATLIGRWVAGLTIVGAAAPLAVSYLDGRVALKTVLVALGVVLAAALAVGVRVRVASYPAIAATLGLVVSWALADVGMNWHGAIRLAHLTAFSLWLGGALWNIFVAMPVGRRHADVDSVIVGARQLDRFRWVVRFALPTIIVTGLVMAGAYRAVPLDWWMSWPGMLIPLKVLTIVALVVIFITCPLFRQCSPVQGVCNIDDLKK